MEPWQREEKKNFFEIKGNIGPVYRIIKMDRIRMGDNTTHVSNRLVTRGNTIHRRSIYSNTMQLQKRMMGSPTAVHDEQRKVKRQIHDLRNSLVQVQWPEEYWKKPGENLRVRQTAMAALNNPTFEEVKKHRWVMGLNIVMTKFVEAIT